MSSVQDIKETILGSYSMISIAGNIYGLKRLWGITKDAAKTDIDVNSDHTDYTFGGRNHALDVTIEATTPDLPTIDAWSDPDSDNDYTELAIIVTLPPAKRSGLSTVTASFNAKLPHEEIGQPSSEGNVLIRVAGPITSKTITWA
jgi:hypothetical protein